MSELPDFREAAILGVQVAGDWLVEALRQLVGFQGSEWNRSRPGEPPYRQSGRGQDSIVATAIPDGTWIGPDDAEFDGFNYMAGWDRPEGIRGVRRPWLSLWKRYLPEIDRIIRRQIQLNTGAE